MSRTRKDFKRDKRRPFVPKGSKRRERWYDGESLMASGTVVFKAHGQKGFIAEG